MRNNLIKYALVFFVSAFFGELRQRSNYIEQRADKKTNRWLLSAAPVFAQKEQWTIRDYLKNLPEQYKTYSGDYPKPPPTEAIVLDDENGYAAILNMQIGVSSTSNYPVFEMALFKRSNGEQMLVVSNIVSNSVCLTHKTFFLQKRGDSWLDVSSRVLPKEMSEMLSELLLTQTLKRFAT